jgi:hypothetical protein
VTGYVQGGLLRVINAAGLKTVDDHLAALAVAAGAAKTISG